VSRSTSSRREVLGIQVTRTAALPPASGSSVDLFSIDGGAVLLTAFYGYVTVAIPNVTISFALDLDPDDGGSNVALASALSAQADAAGTYYRLNTTTGGALVDSGLNVGTGIALATPLALDAGDIMLTSSAGGAIGTAARVKWVAGYVPLDNGARLTAV
jgi:hypothetical protein